MSILRKVKWGVLAGLVMQVIKSAGVDLPEGTGELIQFIADLVPVLVGGGVAWKVRETPRTIAGLKLLGH